MCKLFCILMNRSSISRSVLIMKDQVWQYSLTMTSLCQGSPVASFGQFSRTAHPTYRWFHYCRNSGAIRLSQYIFTDLTCIKTLFVKPSYIQPNARLTFVYSQVTSPSKSRRRLYVLTLCVSSDAGNATGHGHGCGSQEFERETWILLEDRRQ